MRLDELILSSKISYRIGRHLLFWLVCVWLFHIQNDERTLLYDGSSLPAFIFSVYAFLYYLSPFLKQKKFIRFGFGFLIICIITLLLSYLGSYLCFTIWSKGDIPDKKMGFLFEMGRWNQAMAIWMGVVAMGIKATKDSYTEQMETMALAKQKARNELQLEKANLYPEFILQALDNLQLKIKKGAPESPGLVMNLSDSLSYILYDSQNELVELDKELVMVNNIMAFKKMNWAERFTTQLTIIGNPKNKFIPPLALFKLIENLFEIITNEPESSGKVQISIKIENDSLTFTLTNIFESGQDKWESRLATFREQINKRHNESYEFIIAGQESRYSISFKLPLTVFLYPGENRMSPSIPNENVLA